jgi:Flp pilus assembly protein TadG
MNRQRFSVKKLIKDRKGQAIVELALVLPIFLSLLCGIFELGWVYANQLMLANISREVCAAALSTLRDRPRHVVTDRILSIAPDYARDELVIDVTYSNRRTTAPETLL